MRDDGLLESALQRPTNRFRYEEIDDLHVLGATYVVGVAANHPVVDGNKRAAFLAGGLFLNGLQLVAEQADAALTVLAVAAGNRDVDQLADWMRARTVSR